MRHHHTSVTFCAHVVAWPTDRKAYHCENDQSWAIIMLHSEGMSNCNPNITFAQCELLAISSIHA